MLKYHTNTRFRFLIDICELDYPSRKQRFKIVHNLLRATVSSFGLNPFNESTNKNIHSAYILKQQFTMKRGLIRRYLLE